ncbi:hypothetical protein CALVIDRAFT_595345 [Calocera viscosa TUFC12733]|uniref:RNase III domain-containing protein n=1 Tax=Calocera viscosa (strain TUFC12733) TaxID=1330018 RepID=A0A167R4V6_CALVF|nr:hypothetical protein CALVIDRAFT_595345 [Calocera viscosa TUFC12733]
MATNVKREVDVKESQLPNLPEVPNHVRHRVFRHSGMGDNNERLANLGAVILPVIVTEWLMDTKPNATSGDLTIQRSLRVDKKVISKWSRLYGLPDHLVCAANEVNVRASVAAQCQVFYAYIGAVRQTEDEDEEQKEYGWTAVCAFVRQILEVTPIQ